MEIEKITVLAGRDKAGGDEPVERIDLRMGEVVSVVGPTGSGKTALINDIGLFADGGTPTGRQVLINDAPPSPELLEDPAKNPIALITQHTSFLSDLPVHRFLLLHARIRKTAGGPEAAVAETLDFANRLTGEPIAVDSAMTELSGGQTRALLIADAVVIGHAPIILLDEIENAGIDRARALALLRRYPKLFLFVTHDIGIALQSSYRLVMKGGAVRSLVRGGDSERRLAVRVQDLDRMIQDLQDRLRAGEALSENDLDRGLAELLPAGQGEGP